MPPDLASLRAAAQDLAAQPLQTTVDPLVGYCQRWLRPDDPLRPEAVQVLQATTGLSEPMIHWGLETTFGAWVGRTGDEAAAIRALVAADLGASVRLGVWGPGFRPNTQERWVPAGVVVQILAGNVFAATVHQLLAGLLARTAQVLKPASGEAPFLELLRRTLSQVDPALAATVAIVPFTANRADAPLRTALYQAADVITVTGSDATIVAVRGEVAGLGLDPAPAIHGFGHRLSAAYVAAYHLEAADRRSAVWRGLAVDTCAYDQSGCLSPQVAFLEDVLPTELPSLAQECFAALQGQTTEWPVGERGNGYGAARRSFLDRVRMEGGTVVDDGAVAVAVQTGDRIIPGPGGRVLALAPLAFPQGALERLEPFRGHLGTLGVALHPAVPLAKWRQSTGLFPKPAAGAENSTGFNRICPIGRMQTPAIAEPHDGRPRLRLFLRKEQRPTPGLP
ncbi:MAG TPA: acyl-CoA reductase [bacterium]|nr:acyl-CoA reductase [bacterium]